MQDCVLISACLLGKPCRYDGKSKPIGDLKGKLERRGFTPVNWVPVCPEELGGLGTPRPPAQLSGGDGTAVLAGTAQVLRVEDKKDVTEAFVTGARRALQERPHAVLAVLKARSPSCGCGETWIDGSLQQGDGVFAALVKEQGIPIYTEESLELENS